jgi:hypothetical protein
MNQYSMLNQTHSNGQSQTHLKPDPVYNRQSRYWEILSGFVIPTADQIEMEILKIMKIKTN